MARTTWLPVSLKHGKSWCRGRSCKRKREIALKGRRSVVRSTWDVTPTAWDLQYYSDCTTWVNKLVTLFHCVYFPYHDTTHIKDICYGRRTYLYRGNRRLTPLYRCNHRLASTYHLFLPRKNNIEKNMVISFSPELTACSSIWGSIPFPYLFPRSR